MPVEKNEIQDENDDDKNGDVDIEPQMESNGDGDKSEAAEDVDDRSDDDAEEDSPGDVEEMDIEDMVNSKIIPANHQKWPRKVCDAIIDDI